MGRAIAIVTGANGLAGCLNSICRILGAKATMDTTSQRFGVWNMSETTVPTLPETRARCLTPKAR